MKRRSTRPRDGWQQTVESQGLPFHTVDGYAYWDESAFYAFSGRDIDALEAATTELHRLCLQAVDHAIAADRLEQLGVPRQHRHWIAQSRRAGQPTLYGRFDLAYDGCNPPRLLEYNADTPTALVEAAVTQWYWLQDCFPAQDQYNSIHDRLVETWRGIGGDAPLVHFACMFEMDEDWMTVNYLRDAAVQAGLKTRPIAVEDIGWRAREATFVGEHDEPLRTIFKLYPWEWLLREPFARHLAAARTTWIEPPWKTLLSTKALLPLLWELFPDHPNLLPAAFEPLSGDQVRKAIHGREGANIRIERGGLAVLETDGPYEGPFIYQQFAPLRRFDGHCPVVGSWVVGEKACGIGVREDASPVTRNTSSFVPHVLE